MIQTVCPVAVPWTKLVADAPSFLVQLTSSCNLASECPLGTIIYHPLHSPHDRTLANGRGAEWARGRWKKAGTYPLPRGCLAGDGTAKGRKYDDFAGNKPRVDRKVPLGDNRPRRNHRRRLAQ